MTVKTRRRKTLPAPAGRELRIATLTGIEVRANDDDGPIGFRGHAAIFDTRTRIGGKWGFYEQIAPGAFADSIQNDDVRMLKNHNTDLVLARNAAGNLRLSEDDIGLVVDADITPTTYARDLALSLEAGDVSQMSFGFQVLEDNWEMLDGDDEGEELRTLKRVKLWEVSPVTFPAYADTDASLRARDLDILARTLGLNDDQVHELADEIRAGDLHIDDLLPRLVPPATRAPSETPATGSTSHTGTDDDTRTPSPTPTRHVDELLLIDVERFRRTA